MQIRIPRRFIKPLSSVEQFEQWFLELPEKGHRVTLPWRGPENVMTNEAARIDTTQTSPPSTAHTASFGTANTIVNRPPATTNISRAVNLEICTETKCRSSEDGRASISTQWPESVQSFITSSTAAFNIEVLESAAENFGRAWAAYHAGLKCLPPDS
jgi:hypothetical protein